MNGSFRSMFHDRFGLIGDSLRQPGFAAYLLKAALGVAVCYGLHLLIPGHETLWSIVSVVLVLAPDDKDAIRLAFDRMKANSMGAFVGWLAALTGLPAWLALPLAVPFTVLLCLPFRLGAATRSALAGLVIVFVPQPGSDAGTLALERVFFVFVGCVVGLLITVGSRLLARAFRRV
ncbi:MAG: FUSC family protein [Spirochaetes bacterium]|nr:FUSC family protein [Spirochaetota bacterium]MBU0955317.1 FUSC family protein [Spirochaetota bacterium]